MKRHPNPLAIARLSRGPVEVVPDPVEPDPLLEGLAEPPRSSPDTAPTTFATRPRVPVPPALCGHCTHPFEGHGRQYGALVGWHEWAPELFDRPLLTGAWPHHTPEENPNG